MQFKPLNGKRLVHDRCSEGYEIVDVVKEDDEDEMQEKEKKKEEKKDKAETRDRLLSACCMFACLNV